MKLIRSALVVALSIAAASCASRVNLAKLKESIVSPMGAADAPSPPPSTMPSVPAVRPKRQ